MTTAVDLVNSIRFEGASIVAYPDGLHPIGKGRSAAVFKLSGEEKVVKVFYPEFHNLAVQEAEIYKELDNDVYYPKLYEVGEGYLILEYLDGITFYDCLIEGVEITREMVEVVDEALNYARTKGLNPSDTHLQNVMLLKNGEVRVIDVVRFRQTKECSHWEDLKTAYDTIYCNSYFPKKVPAWIVETVIRLYRKGIIKFNKGK
ncbi:serine/threonine protein kinase [Alkalihalobacillus sp. CinArs1]|uniref:serine/threonine protein kinase n=1 Tax=Alkalihalobacillus sp. CinArs1 TaxID=2995314 RepID=UPI0022DE06ED|nr:serine/threonine protein kinase [Alkalihalobacillus sp. CinArs1]